MASPCTLVIATISCSCHHVTRIYLYCGLRKCFPKDRERIQIIILGKIPTDSYRVNTIDLGNVKFSGNVSVLVKYLDLKFYLLETSP